MLSAFVALQSAAPNMIGDGLADFSRATTHGVGATLLQPIRSTPPAGLSVEAKDAPFGKGFDFKFKSGSATTTLTIDPLGTRHTGSASLSSSAGSVQLTGKYDRNDRAIEIIAKRGGTEIGSYSWRVEAVLR